MRRKDREVTDLSKIRDIIAACECCRLGLRDADNVYVIPMSFGYDESEGVFTFYFHSANKGRKIDLLCRNASVGFEMDTHCELKTSDTPCGYSVRFQSVIGTGTVLFLENLEEKHRALSLIMQHYTGKSVWEFSQSMLETVCVFRLTAETLSCKEHQ